MADNRDLDDLLLKLRQAEAQHAPDEELAAMRKAIASAGNREAAARQLARDAERWNRLAPGAKPAQSTPTMPQYTATPEIQALLNRLRGLLRQSELAPHTEALIARVEPTIVLRMSTNSDTSDMTPQKKAVKEHDLPLGASRFGFLHDLPAEMAWPTYKGDKLTFLAQLDLAEFPRWPGSPLPEDGWLFAFASIPLQITADQNWRYAIMYHRGPRHALQRQSQKFFREEFLPTADEEPFFDLVTFTPTLALDVDPLLVDQLEGANAVDIHDLLEKVSGFNNDRYSNMGFAGHLLGQSGDFNDHTAADTLNSLIQSGLHPVPLRLARQPDGPGNDWIHLFSLRSVGSMQWCDAGFIYFLIRRSDLLARRFENVVLSLCST